MPDYDYILNIQNLIYFNKCVKDDFPSVDHVNYTKNIKTVSINFSEDLSEQDKTALDLFIGNYTDIDPPDVRNTSVICSTLTSTDLTEWNTILTWEENTEIHKIECLAKLQASDSDYLYNEDFKYSGRIINTTHNTVVSPETDFFNSEYGIIEFPISMVLYDTTVNLELQVKKYNKGSYIYIKSCSKHY